MNRYDWTQQLPTIYAGGLSEKERRPVIGITGNYGDLTCKLGEGYYKQIVRAGGTPLIIPPSANTEVLTSLLNRIDALLLSGGADFNPLYCGEEPSPKLGGINAERDLPELLICKLAANRQMPILGICRGIQTMAMALGGKVEQHISTDIKHSQDADRSEPTHTVMVEPETTLYNIYARADVSCSEQIQKKIRLCVNSFHHQAVAEPGAHFLVSARAKDGVIEAIESSEHKPFLGVQWHPECLGDDGLPIFKWLIDEATRYQQAQQLHDHILTLDTHCDTPMFFSQNIDFCTRDSKILVDLPKMQEGRLDATIMVAYLPQKREEWPAITLQNTVPTSGREFADSIFSRIQAIVDSTPHVSIVNTFEELWENKMEGRKSIMLGIENGAALDGNIKNIKHFAQTGVVYITLCHNGDNDICDSARGSQTHGGLSAFGREVIAEMNRLGLMVDLSHAAESSFYDALEVSATPIVCSHSSCRALCDHPHNLTDDQMRALAQKDGVCQITLYHGFLVKDGEASILDAMRHLDHAIDIMGIDHVGLGTDFDGDGGVKGLADASELTLFTRQLLARRYNKTDIQKIWGGNFLRVMRQVQNTTI